MNRTKNYRIRLGASEYVFTPQGEFTTLRRYHWSRNIKTPAPVFRSSKDRSVVVVLSTVEARVRYHALLRTKRHRILSILQPSIAQ